MLNIVQEFKSAVAGIVFALFLWGVVSFSGLTIWPTFALLSVINLCLLLYTRSFTFWQYFKNCGVILFFILFFHWMNAYGVMGYVVGIGVALSWIFYTRWSKFVEVKQYIETQIWGKPLSQFIKDKERPPSIKLVR